MKRVSNVLDSSIYRLQIIGGTTHESLVQNIATHLNITPTKVSLGKFANGELSCRIEDSVRGNDVFIIQTHSSPVNDALIEQLLVIDAARRASAKSITAVCPFLGYSRQDRKAKGREPIGAKLIIDLFATAGADRIMSVDLHSGQIQGFFDGPFDHLIAMPIFKQYIENNYEISDTVIVSPDAGRVKLSERYSRYLGCEMAIIHKQRSTTKRNAAEAKHLIGEVKGKECLIIDDMIDTAGTICAAANLLAENGAKAVYGFATHGVFSGPAYERIEQSSFEKVIVTDTLPVTCKQSKKIEILSIAPLIASAINAACKGESVSALFMGENQF